MMVPLSYTVLGWSIFWGLFSAGFNYSVIVILVSVKFEKETGVFFLPNKASMTECSSLKKKDSCHFNAKVHHKLDLDVKAFFLCIVLAHWVLQVMLA